MKATDSPPTTKENPPQPSSADQLEERAADIAKRSGRKQVTSADREAAYKEMQETAPHKSADESASH